MEKVGDEGDGEREVERKGRTGAAVRKGAQAAVPNLTLRFCPSDHLHRRSVLIRCAVQHRPSV